MSRNFALCLVSLALVSLVTATESVEEFAELRARAKKLAESGDGKAYDERFSDAPSFAKPLQAALKTCTEQAKPPYAVNLVIAINADGSLQRIAPSPDQPVSACVAAKLEGVKLPEPPKSEWLVALNIAIKDPEPIQDSGPAMAPTEFVTQVLEPTGGKILRPKDWFYDESHNESSYTWTLSREDTTKGRYATGVRIQTIVGVKKGTGKSPKKFILDYVAAKKKAADKIVDSCGETNQGMFRRVCLETEEGPFHILYSFFWGKNNIDIVVVSIAGTKKEYWDIYRPTFVDKMGTFELIDLKRFENKDGPTPSKNQSQSRHLRPVACDKSSRLRPSAFQTVPTATPQFLGVKSAIFDRVISSPRKSVEIGSFARRFANPRVRHVLGGMNFQTHMP